jgi:hypothetical protein
MASNTTFHRYATAVEATVMVLAILTLGLASAYGVQLSKAPLYFRLSKETLHIQWSTALVRNPALSPCSMINPWNL